MAIKKDGRANNGRKAGTTKNKVQGEIVKAPKKAGSEKKDLSDYTAITNDEVLKVKDGESLEQWEKRTKRRRPLNLKNQKTQRHKQIEFLENGKIIFQRIKLKGMKRDLKTSIFSKYIEQPFDYMKYYGLVMRWASIKYGITKDAFEIGFYFFDREPFSAEEFNIHCTQLGTVRGMFSKFYKNGYIYPIEIIVGNNGETKSTNTFCLTKEFMIRIRGVYKVLSKIAPPATRDLKYQDEEFKEVYLELKKMYEESEEIMKGIKKPELIRFRNEDKEE